MSALPTLLSTMIYALASAAELPTWPLTGIGLHENFMAQGLANEVVMKWSPLGDACLVCGYDALLLATPDGLRRLGKLGRDGSSMAFSSGRWLADGRWLAPDALGGLVAVTTRGLQVLLPPEAARPALKPLQLSPDRKYALVVQDREVEGDPVAWLLEAGSPTLRALTLPGQADGRLYERRGSGLSWLEDGALIVLRAAPDEQQRITARWRSEDHGVTWIPHEDRHGVPPCSGPIPLGQFGSRRREQADVWNLAGGGTIRVEPTLEQTDIPVGQPTRTLPPASRLVITLPGQAPRNHAWPVDAGDRPWPMALLPDGSLLVARHSLFTERRGSGRDIITWEPVVTAWVVITPDGTLRPISLPIHHDSEHGPRTSLERLLVGADGVVLALGHDLDDSRQGFLRVVRSGQPARDVVAELGLPADYAMTLNAGPDQLMVCNQMAMQLLAPGQCAVLVWTKQRGLVLLQRDTKHLSGVANCAWDDTGTRLAWIQGECLRVWTTDQAGMPWPTVAVPVKLDN